MTETLTTFAPAVTARSLHPTGNLLVALPEIDDRGWCRSLNVASEAERGLVAAVAPDDDALIRPVVAVDGVPLALQPTWTREHDWVPIGVDGPVTLRYLVPDDEAGVVARLTYVNDGPTPCEVALAFTGRWAVVQVHQFTAKPLELPLRTRDDAWTGARTVFAGADRLLLSLSWRAGEGARHGEAPEHGWRTERTASVQPGDRLELDVFVGVGTEPDGSGATALHLRRRGHDALAHQTAAWLDAHALRTGDAALDARLNLNLFFNWFYAQADCLDTGRLVMMTSRSPRYYVSGAFWSRDAYWWSFPAMLLTDAARARDILVTSIGTAGRHIAQHALTITGARLYPGFELDELTAPLIAIWRYVDATGDHGVLHEQAVGAYLAHFDAERTRWFDADLGLYATMLLPTDDPTDHPFVATANATMAVALTALSRLVPGGDHAAEADALRAAVVQRFVDDGRWAWACDREGRLEHREEPPLSLRTLGYFGIDEPEASAATVRWLITDYAHHYPGRYPGAGAPHFASPSSFDLANRMLTDDHGLGDPVLGFVQTPLDNGVACESWDPHSGRVATGAAMASAAGFLAWTAWANRIGHRRWDDGFAR